MSLALNFEPHSWYMGFAIGQYSPHLKPSKLDIPYYAVTDNGMTGYIDQLEGNSLGMLKAKIRRYHLDKHTGYGERVAARRLKYLRAEIDAERISYSEIAELQGLADYIDDADVQLLEWANVPEGSRK